MGESDGAWGELVEQDPELGEVWDEYSRLPEPGDNDVLDAFCARKHVDIPALVRIGGRLSEYRVLAFAGPGYIKYRNMEDGRRWTVAGASYPKLRIVPGLARDGDSVIVAEGETDAARLTMLYPTCDVAVLPAGARTWGADWGPQLEPYARVYGAHDEDDAGAEGYAKLAAAVPHAVRFPAGTGSDWCAMADDEEPPPLPEVEEPLPVLVSAGRLLTIELPETASYFEDALLPIGGQLVLHAWAKNFKSFIALDMLAALAQGQSWCHFRMVEEPVAVAVVQFEIPPVYYKQRIVQLRATASEPELFDENFMTWRPLSRPMIHAGNKQQEEFVRRTLVEKGIGVVLMDPVRRLMPPGMSLNDEDSVRQPLAFFEALQREGITVVFCHHDNKAGAKGEADETSMTGSGAWAGDADTIVGVSRPKGFAANDSRRNLSFLLRNAPSPDKRGFEIAEDGTISYRHESWAGEDPDDADAPRI